MASTKKVAEFRGEHGERVVFHNTNTKITYSAEIYADVAGDVFKEVLEG
jgi:hypothetical protein